MNNVIVDLPEDNDRFLIHPLNDEKYMRWLMKENDPDFEWADVKWTNITEEK